jgi:glucose-1-phosphate cytidylyltransferase
MKVVILAGGRGTRMGPGTQLVPKPMLPVGGRPLLCHIMSHYARHGFTDFVLAIGHMGDVLRDYFLVADDGPRDLGTDNPCLGDARWRLALVDTGLQTANAGRIRRLAPYLAGERFMLTWGDGVSDVDLGDLLKFHRRHGKLATVTAVHPPSRFGHLTLDGDAVADFEEKPRRGPGWINGAFYVLEPAVLDYIQGDADSWERDLMPRLVRDGQLMAYRHEGFWQCMDTPGEMALLDELWRTGNASWKTWS